MKDYEVLKIPTNTEITLEKIINTMRSRSVKKRKRAFCDAAAHEVEWLLASYYDLKSQHEQLIDEYNDLQRMCQDGEWIPEREGPGTYSHCSVCGCRCAGYSPNYIFCPSCGARMKGVGDGSTSEHPCRTCGHGWGTAYMGGIKTCHERCHEIEEYNKKRESGCPCEKASFDGYCYQEGCQKKMEAGK